MIGLETLRKAQTEPCIGAFVGCIGNLLAQHGGKIEFWGDRYMLQGYGYANPEGKIVPGAFIDSKITIVIAASSIGECAAQVQIHVIVAVTCYLFKGMPKTELQIAPVNFAYITIPCEERTGWNIQAYTPV